MPSKRNSAVVRCRAVRRLAWFGLVWIRFRSACCFVLVDIILVSALPVDKLRCHWLICLPASLPACLPEPHFIFLNLKPIQTNHTPVPPNPTPPNSTQPDLTLSNAVALAGTEATRNCDYSRLSCSSRHHPLARASAASLLASASTTSTSGGGDSSSSNNNNNNASAGVQELGRKSSVALLRGGGSADLIAATQDHAGFTVRKDGTAGKVYVDIEGGATGVSLVHVSTGVSLVVEVAMG